MQILSVPRLNGSEALKQTRQALSDWLVEHEINHTIHRFRLYPYFIEIGGIWLVVTQILLAVSIWFRWGWVALIVAFASLVVVILETMGIPLVSRLLSDTGENIVIELEPQALSEQEIILSAHYDSKTELFNDQQRIFFMGKLPLAMGLTLLLGTLGIVNELLQNSTSKGTEILYIVSIALTVPLLALFIPLGVNFVFGRFASPSQGAIDNGASCAILLDIADQINKGVITLKQTKISVVLFCGEEVVVQGSRAFVSSRTFPLPTAALNLELMGQNGDYVIWEKIGSPIQSYQSDSSLNVLLTEIVNHHAETRLKLHDGPAGSDSLPFLTAGIPATSLASLDGELGFSGLHSPQDNLERIAYEKLPNSIALVENLLYKLDSIGVKNITHSPRDANSAEA